jgi:hypothetical protein
MVMSHDMASDGLIKRLGFGSQPLPVVILSSSLIFHSNVDASD